MHIPVVQEMLEKILPPLNGGICDARTGWLPAGFDYEVRGIVLNCSRTVLRNYFRKKRGDNSVVILFTFPLKF